MRTTRSYWEKHPAAHIGLAPANLRDLHLEALAAVGVGLSIAVTVFVLIYGSPTRRKR